MRTVLLLGVWFLTAVAVPAQSEPKGLQARLDVPVNKYSLSGNGLVNALAKIAEQFEIPMGIEWVRDKEALRKINLEDKTGTVRDVLDSVLDRYPGYAWDAEDSIVRMFRRDLVNDQDNFLNLKIPNYFEAHQEAGGLINQQSQFVIQNLVSPQKLPPGAGVGGSYATSLQEKPLTLTLRGLTVREALDKLVDASEHKIWVVTFSETAGRTPTGFRRTETLWHLTPFPDRVQPMWDFLTWQEFARISSPGVHRSE